MDNNLIKKVTTYKSGKFVFSSKFSLEKLVQLLVETRILNKTVADLPILPALSANLNEELIRRSIFGTAAIEGNPLKEDEVERILSEEGVSEKLKQSEKEIRNLKEAYDYVNGLELASPACELTEEVIRKVHYLITKDIKYKYNTPGQYRNHVVKVGDEEHGGIYRPPPILADIKKLMKEFISWINSKDVMETIPPIRAALAHYHLGLIHPFANGNGRTARLVEAMLLRSAGMKYAPVMLSNFYYQNIDEYFWAFSNSQKSKEHDLTPFLEFVHKGLVESLNKIKDRITFFIRVFALRDYYSFFRTEKILAQRQHDLLILLLDNLKPFKLGDLFTTTPYNILYGKVSERTARRDLKKLLDKGLLRLEDKNSYMLNLEVLG
jgi:Fic family protein